MPRSARSTRSVSALQTSGANDEQKFSAWVKSMVTQATVIDFKDGEY